MLSKFENDGKLNPSFKTGPFQLPLAKIWGYPKEPQAPRFVLVSSAGVTRPDRCRTHSQTAAASCIMTVSNGLSAANATEQTDLHDRTA